MTEFSERVAKHHATLSQLGAAAVVGTSRNHGKRHVVRKENTRDI